MQPLIFITVGYITGILWGLYLKINIVPIIFLLGGGIFILSKRINIVNKYKICFSLIIIFAFISNIQIVKLENKFNTLYKKYTNVEEINIIGIITNEGKETNYKTSYTLKVESINGNSKYKNTYVMLYIKKVKKN